MKDEMNLNEWVEAFDRGDFDAGDRETQIKAGWYDWFCDDKSLANKTSRLGIKVKQIAASPLFDNEKVYVFFKNNCPCFGGLYDDFRICDIESGDVLYTVIPRCGHTAVPKDKKSQVFYAPKRKYEVEGTWKDVKKFFQV